MILTPKLAALDARVVELLRADPRAKDAVSDARKRGLAYDAYQTARREASEARRARPTDSDPLGYARIKTARAKRARRQRRNLNSLAL